MLTVFVESRLVVSRSVEEDKLAPDLPIDQHKTIITDAIDTHGLVVVEAPTGSGKSTRIPLWLDDQVDGQVVVVQPRRVAARSLARFLASGRGEPAGQTIGYRVRFDDQSSASTRILFVTPGVMLRMLRADSSRWPAAVILDEFHERGLEVDLCAAVLLDARKRGRADMPLILTSATLDGQTIVDRIGGHRVTAEGRIYPVGVTYTDEPSAPGSEDLDVRVGRVVRRELGNRDGDVLVFLPGKGEIDGCREALGRIGSDVDVLPFHANLNSDAVERVFRESDHRRVFLATNVAETSLTLPGVRTVIDSGLVRQMVHRGGHSALALMPVSQASLDQRAGRAGRTAPGHCVRLFSQHFQPEVSDRPEIERLELDDLVVQAGACGLNVNGLAEAPWVTPPPEFALERAVTTMRDRGVLDAEGKLSERGRQLADLPVSASVARAILDAPEGLRGTVADVIAIAERGEGLLRFGGGSEQVVEARSKLLEDTRSDVEAGVRILRGGDVQQHGLSRSTVEETRRTAETLRRLVGARHARPTDDGPRVDLAGLARHLLNRLPEQAFVLRPRALKASKRSSRPGRSVPYANGEIELSVDPWEAGETKPPPAGVILRVFWSGSGKGRGVFGRGSLLVPCLPDWLAEAGLGEVEVGKISVTRAGGQMRLEAQVNRTLAGVVLLTEVESLEGELAIDAAARLVAEGRLLKPAAEHVADALHLSEVARLLRLTNDRLPFESVEEAVRRRFVDLGVREAADLSLVEADDLSIDVAGLLDLDAEVVRQLANDLPREWTHAGLVHRVCVERKPTVEVILEVAKTSSAKAKPPSAGVIPRFRDLPVKWRKASRTVQIR